MTAELPEPGFPQGLSWSWEMDFDAVLAALSDYDASRARTPGASFSGGSTAGTSAADTSAADGSTGDADSTDPDVDDGAFDEEAYLAALDQGTGVLPVGVIAARVAERLAPGPDLVAWLATAPAADQSDYDLPGSASSWRRVAAYAQSQELAAVAQIASRAARRDPKIGAGPDGRPARVTAAATAEVSLALTMTRDSAAAWTDLAVDLTWRLPATGTALAQGLIDLPRARLISEATSLLSDTAARTVEDRVLPTAGQQTTGTLRDALSRAVLAADPTGAEQRRKNAERRAKVSLYPDHDGTATLTAQGLPPISGAAAITRLTAMARAMITAGYTGGIDFLRTQILIGLILGTLPYIPPAPDAPPDDEPTGQPGGPSDGSEGPEDPGSGPGSPPGSPGGRGDGPGSRPSGGPDDDPGADPNAGPAEGPAGPADGPAGGVAGQRDGLDDGPWDGYPDPRDEDAPEDSGDDLITRQPSLKGNYWPGSGYLPSIGPRGVGPRGADPPADAWLGPRDDEHWLESGPLPSWPDLPAMIPPVPIPPGLASARPGPSMSRPVPGLLDVSVPWHTLTGLSLEPGHLGRIGPVPALDARRLADCAARDPATTWRIVVTNRAGQALAVTRLTRRAGRADKPTGATGPTGLRSAPGNGGVGIGLVGRITVTITEDVLDSTTPPLPGPDPLPILQQALRRAAKALASARANAEADATAGGCAHLTASSAYQIPPRLRDYITARDITCRFTTCRQPVWCCDIDHTTPYDQGGRTCKCNTGGLCRVHHQIKQLPGWTLHQVSPGVFQWTTPGGRVYATTPDIHPL